MAQLCAGAMYATRPSFHFNSAISGLDGGATFPPSGTPGIDRVMGNNGTVLHRTGHEAKHAVVTVDVRLEAKGSARRWLLPERPIPERCVEAYYLQKPGSRSSPNGSCNGAS